MRFISFGWTWPALVAGQKTVTRREWKLTHARSFHEGDLVAAWDHLPFVGGHQVATIRLTQDPQLEAMSAMPDQDYDAEGFRYFEEHPGELPTNAPWSEMNWRTFKAWQDSYVGQVLWVVRFDLVEVLK